MLLDFSRRKWGFLLLSLLFASCVSPSDLPALSGPVALPTCIPMEADANPYKRSDPTSMPPAPSFYQNYTEQSGDPLLKQKAFNLLKEQVRAWSDHVDISVSGNLIVRVTVTYVSPQLIEIAVLNETLHDSIPQINFDNRLQNTLNEIAERNEYLFLVTLTASQYEHNVLQFDPLLVEIPFDKMVLTNSENLAVGPRHWDNHLSHRIDLRGEPEHGYVGYQIGAEKDQSCHWLLDPTWNTTISLSVPNLYINGIDSGPQTWSMDYHTLIRGIDFSAELLAGSIDMGTPPVIYSPVMTPPPAANRTADEKDSEAYWDVMSSYVWYHLTKGIHH